MEKALLESQVLTPELTASLLQPETHVETEAKFGEVYGEEADTVNGLMKY
jgi:hypothetical protein